MASLSGSQQGDPAVRFDGRLLKRGEGDEGIVLSGDEQGGDANIGQDMSGADALVIVRCAEESSVRRGIGVVELAQAGDRIQRREVELAGKVPRFSAESSLDVGQEIPLIEPVGPALQGGDAGGGVDIGTTATTPRSA